MITEETPFYLIFYNGLRGLEIADNYIEEIEGEGNLNESLISHFNYFIDKYYEEPDQADYEELVEDTVVFQMVDKSDLIKTTINHHLNKENEEEYKQYLKMKKKYEKKKR
jgi:hypothetical protein